MVEYYREALYEAVTYCLTKGLSEKYVASLDVTGFGELYKYLMRIDARQRISFIGDVRTAYGADKKAYGKYLKSIEVWLPEQESSTTKLSADEFESALTKGLI
jgi:hypothetical protein